MGYCIDQTDSEFLIKESNVKSALKALKELARDFDMGAEKQRYSQRFGDVKWPHLSQALEALDFDNEFNDDGDCISIRYSCEKSGDEETILKRLAPFVEDGCFIEFCGEDGEKWRYFFSQGKLWTQLPEISWGEPTLVK